MKSLTISNNQDDINRYANLQQYKKQLYKQLKKYYRRQKLDLIEINNPEWNDLYYDIIQ